MNLYEENGYLDMQKIIALPDPFVFIIGGRGIGKTYGALKCVISDRIPFMLMRRTQTQADLIKRDEFSPINPVCRDLGIAGKTKSITKFNAGIYLQSVDNSGDNADEILLDDEPLGITCALTTIANIRGFDASNIRILLYDEFIPEKHEKPIRQEAKAFFNAYETINRNRELSGRDPLKCVCMANSETIGNPIFMHLGIVNTVEKMQRKGVDMWRDQKRGICVIIPHNSQISEKKSKTALYRLQSDSDYTDMAISNGFRIEESDRIRPQPIAEYVPIAHVGEISIYKHKSIRDRYYITQHRTGGGKEYTATENDLKRFRRDHPYMIDVFFDGETFYETPACVIIFKSYLDGKI